ncbi:MAG: ribonuclease Y [Wolinella succinogenes]|uniref:ribonuclease Y n=1 Tax=Wolinella succinogenes TaxID=844 RepID=UPI0016B38FDF|nr:ribonuclease Y [Wolinella succinogenes]NLU34406.1 ribonuclease Y [Wolinella succinogenes]
MIEWTILSSLASALLAGGGTYLVYKKVSNANYKIHLEKAKARARAIEHEAEMILQEAKIHAKELEIGAKSKYENETSKVIKEYESYLIKLEKQEAKNQQRLEREMQQLEEERRRINHKQASLSDMIEELEKLKSDYRSKLTESLEILSRVAGLTQEEAKELALAKATEESRAQIAQIVRKYESEAKEEGRKRANYILAQATTRFAGEFAAERLINVVNLPNDELKGRIIGKEGRNIKTLEMLSGVDVIIDDTPGAIVLSSFNLYRRAIATRTIEALVEDGRIQPARIEEVYKKVEQEFEEKVLEEGEGIVLDMELGYVHPELKKLIGRLKYRASYGQNALGHSLEVANLAGVIAGELGGDVKLAKRAGLLHDIGKALTHDFGGSHVDLGAEVCSRYKEHPAVINAIFAHHGHEEAKSIESAAVCAADALSAARPGARREVLESFLKRVQEIEKIAMEKLGVRQAYAINAGREVRVIVNADLINDEESVLLAQEIAKEIETKVQYPGEIKVSVIREVRAVEFAK